MVRLRSSFDPCLVLTSPGDPLQSIIRGRPVEHHGGTLKAISRASDWLKECNEHPNCSPGETQLPSRVIDVGVDANSPHVRLRETETHECGKYICLRYFSRHCMSSSQECMVANVYYEAIAGVMSRHALQLKPRLRIESAKS